MVLPTGDIDLARLARIYAEINVPPYGTQLAVPQVNVQHIGCRAGKRALSSSGSTGMRADAGEIRMTLRMIGVLGAVACLAVVGCGDDAPTTSTGGTSSSSSSSASSTSSSASSTSSGMGGGGMGGGGVGGSGGASAACNNCSDHSLALAGGQMSTICPDGMPAGTMSTTLYNNYYDCMCKGGCTMECAKTQYCTKDHTEPPGACLTCLSQGACMEATTACVTDGM